MVWVLLMSLLLSASSAAVFLSRDRESLANSLPSNYSQDGPEDLLGITSYNVQGIKDREKLSQVKSLLRTRGTHIALLQETKWGAYEHGNSFLRNRLVPSSLSAVSTQENSGGVLAFHMFGLPVMEELDCHEDGRWLIARLHSQVVDAILVNVYAPNDSNGRRRLLLALRDKLRGFVDLGLPFVLAGDWNFVLDPRLDRLSSTLNDAASRTLMGELCEEFGLVDPWRVEFPESSGFTWIREASGRTSAARLDRFYVSESLLDKVVRVEVLDVHLSDHLPLQLVLRSGVPLGQKRFTLNSQLLKNTEICEGIQNILADCESALAEGARHGLDILMGHKGRIRQLVRTRGRLLRRHEVQEEQDLARALAAVKRRMRVEPSSVELLQEYMALVRRQAAQDARKEEYRRQATRAKFHLEGERCNSWWFGKMKTRPEIARIRTLKGADGSLHTSQEGKNVVAEEFYRNLFTAEPLHQESLATLVASVDKVLSPSSLDELQRPFTAAEVLRILQTLPSHKSPGPDGLTYELYKKFKGPMSRIFERVLNELLADPSGVGSKFCEALICLLPKSGLLDEMKNWRPISLANSDYKVLMVCLASRLGNVLPEVVGEEQCGFVRGRSIFDPILTMKSVIRRKKRSNSGMALLLDMEKAYDRVNFDYLFACLTSFGFPPSWIALLQSIYGVGSSRLLLNGHQSAEIPIGRGVRQGCPLSPLLFSIAIEPLANLVRSSGVLKGVASGSTVVKIMLYADDTTLFLHDQVDLAEAERLLEIFERGSGAKINASKSELIPLTTRCPALTVQSRFRLRPQEYEARFLGAKVGVLQTDKASWDPTMVKVKAELDRWSLKGLSLRGKLLVLKSCILSKLTYLLHVQEMPRSLCKKLDRMFACFLSGSKKVEWFPREVIHAPKESGGLGFPSVWAWQLAIGASTRRRFDRREGGLWKQALSRDLANPTCIFRLQTLVDPGDFRRPRQIVSLVDSDLAPDSLQRRSPWLLPEADTANSFLPLRTSAGAPRQVFDLKMKILTNSAVAHFLPSSCPHCDAPDSTEHRFWTCRVAHRERDHLLRLRPNLVGLHQAALFLGCDPACEAYTWRLHLLGLYQMGVTDSLPAPLPELISRFNMFI